jgi:GNAT superfamily N-acetyltransferase
MRAQPRPADSALADSAPAESALADGALGSAIRRAAGDDPYVRLRLDPARVDDVLINGPAGGVCAVAWSSTRPNGERWGVACGRQPEELAELLVRLNQRRALDGVTVPAEAFAVLPAHLASPKPGHWSLWELPPIAGPDPGGASILDPDDERIRPLLSHSSSAHVFPGDRPARWAGVVEGDTLVSVAAEFREPSGLAHVVSVCTLPQARGRGLAGQAIGRLVQQARSEGCSGVVLEMYAANEPARHAYRRLGFVEVGQYRSGLLDPERIAQIEKLR